MNKRLLTGIVSSAAMSVSVAGTTLAAGDGTASNPTKTEAGATGPADSIGKSGSSPTKSMIQKKNERESNQGNDSGMSGTSDNREAAGSGSKKHGGTTLGSRNANASNAASSRNDSAQDASTDRPSGNSERSGR